MSSEIVIPSFDDDEVPSFLAGSAFASSQPFHFQSHSQQSSFSGPAINSLKSPAGSSTSLSSQRQRTNSDTLSRPYLPRKQSNANQQSQFSPFQQNGQQSYLSAARKETVSTFIGIGVNGSSANSKDGNNDAAEQALFIILEAFFEKADEKMADALSRPVSGDHTNDLYLPRILGKGVDPAFDRILDAIAHIGRKIPKTVVDVVMRWRKSQGEGVDTLLVNKAMNMLNNSAMANSVQSQTPITRQVVADVLSERKSLASIYILCRTLLCVVEAVNRDMLGDELAAKLEDIIFNSLKNADPSLVERSANRRANMDAYARLIGALSAIRFMSMSDRFIADLGQVLQGNLTKEAEARVEHLIRGVRFIKLEIYPMELFEEASDFLEGLSNVFEAASGAKIKTALAHTLTHLLSPVVLRATAEVNHPVWQRATAAIYNRALQMSTRPRYLSAALPLMCAVAGASAEDDLLANFNVCVELCLQRLREKSSRATAFHGLLQLVWAYLRRSNETHGNVAKRLDPILKAIFPAQRRLLNPPELSPDVASYLPHLISTRFLEYGAETITALIHPSPIIPTERWPVESLNPERMYVATQALLLTCDTLEQGADPHMPPQPPLFDFDEPLGASSPLKDIRREFLPDALYNRAGLKPLLDSSALAIAKIALACERASESFTTLDDRNIIARNQPSVTLESHLVRRHGPFMVTYPRDRQPYFDLQRACIESWPRLLPRQTPSISDFRPIDILLRCLVHIDIDLSNAAKRALERMTVYKDGHLVLRALSRFVVRPELKVREGGSLQGANTVKLESLVGLWSDLVRIFSEHLAQRATSAQPQSRRMPTNGGEGPAAVIEETDPRSVWPIVSEIEAAALVHLPSQSLILRRRAIEVLRGVCQLQKNIAKWSDDVNGTPVAATDPRIMTVIEERGQSLLAEIEDDALNSVELARLNWWRKVPPTEMLAKLIESDNLLDLVLWHSLWPSLLIVCQDLVGHSVALARPLFVARVLKAYPAASSAASLVPNKVPQTPSTVRPGFGQTQSPLPDLAFLADHWKTHLMALCAITLSTSANSPVVINGEAAPVDGDRLQTGADIVRLAVPFLASDSLPFREAVIRGLGCSNVTMYKALLEGLGSIVRHLMEDHRMRAEQRSQMRRSARHGRLHQAVARVQELSSPLLKMVTGDAEVHLVAQYIKDALAMVRDPEATDEASSMLMRRAFCVCVLNFVEHTAQQNSVRKFLPTDVRHALYALFDSWSFRPLSIASPDNSRHGSRSSDIHSGHQHSKSRASSFGSHASSAYDIFLPAVNANVALCESAALSIKRDHAERSNVLEAQEVLRWAQALFESSANHGHASARRAIGGLIAANLDNRLFLDATVYQCFAEPDSLALQQSTFSVLSGAIIAEPTIAVKPSTAICLALWKLGHTDLPTRQRALDVIAVRLPLEIREISIIANQAAVYSTFSGAILQARARVSESVAASAIADARAVFLELAIRILQLGSKQTRLMMQLLPPWLKLINFPNTNNNSQSGSTTDPVLANLFLLSAKYSDVYQIEIRAMWHALASNQGPNLALIVAFLVQEASVRGAKEFTRHAQRIIGCLSESDISSAVLNQLGDFISPSTLVLPAEQSQQQSQKSVTRRTNLDTLFPINPRRLPMSPAQAALLMVGDPVLERLNTADPNVVQILHVLIMHVDHSTAFIRTQARDIVVRILTLLSRLDGGRSDAIGSSGGPAEILWSWRSFWEQVDSSGNPDSITAQNMNALVSDAVSFLERKLPDVRRLWSLVALEWGLACPLRHIACRSLQILGQLEIPLSENMLADLFARLSNTIADQSLDAQLFAQEILQVLRKAASVSPDALARLPHLWLAATACLETPNEQEFVQVAQLTNDLARNLVDNPALADALASLRPLDTRPLHEMLTSACLCGVRSAAAIDATWSLVQTISSLPQTPLLEVAKATGMIFATTLLFGLEALENGEMSAELENHTNNVCTMATLADQEGYTRVMRSLGKGRFRTKDDFVRQGIAAIREYSSGEERLDVLLLYLGSLQNARSWVRKRALALLKQLFRQITFTEDDLSDLGQDMLAPLMHLLTTDMAPLALEIFDEPAIPCQSIPTNSDPRKNTETCFGHVHPSGWSCPQRDRNADRVRRALSDIAATCGARAPLSATNSPFAFASDEDGNATPHVDNHIHPLDLDENSGLGDMVTTLHDLGSFFDEADATASPAFRMSNSAAASASRVAAVLARSHKGRDFTMEPIPETPTPFSAAFAIPEPRPFSDEYDEENSLDYTTQTESEDHGAWDSVATSSNASSPQRGGKWEF